MYLWSSDNCDLWWFNTFSEWIGLCNCNFLEDLTTLVLIFLIIIQFLGSLICILPPQIILKWSFWGCRSWNGGFGLGQLWPQETPEASLKGPHRSLRSLWQLKYGGLISLPTSGTRTERNTLVLTLELNVQIHCEAEKRFNHQWPLTASADHLRLMQVQLN